MRDACTASGAASALRKILLLPGRRSRPPPWLRAALFATKTGFQPLQDAEQDGEREQNFAKEAKWRITVLIGTVQMFAYVVQWTHGHMETGERTARWQGQVTRYLHADLQNRPRVGTNLDNFMVHKKPDTKSGDEVQVWQRVNGTKSPAPKRVEALIIRGRSGGSPCWGGT